MDSNQEDMVAQFSSVTGANPNTAQAALTSSNWNLAEAVSLYFAAADPEHDHDEDYPEPESARPAQSGPAQGASAGSSRTARSSRPKAMTLRDLQGAGDDDDDDEKEQDMFAGGEKSGLAVQNPGSGHGNSGPVDHFKNILNQARANRDRPEGEDDAAGPSGGNHFTGRAQTLGGDDAPSQVIDDPRAARPGRQRLPRVTRTLHLWSDGVSIDEGPLFRFDDPANQDMMNQINQGRAPLSLLDVQPDQEVDLNLVPHKDEPYVAPKKVYKPFGGQGQRLGSPTPGPELSRPSAPTPASASAPSQPTESASIDPVIDASQPTLQLQVRLGDGSRVQTRFNTSHTIQEVYSYVDRAPGTRRSYVLMTTFPSQELTDKSQVLGEMAEFKRGGVVVQKWT